MSDASDPATYVAAVVTLYVELPDTPLRASVSDQWLARRLHDDGVPLQVVETALLLGSLRRLIRPADAPCLSPIRSLAYFRPVIDELRTHPAPESYLDYLRLKLRQTATAFPADVQKSAKDT
ncbi:MAG TPA: hypothetical protein VHD85_22900 [Terracidiphilus sp.]|jgi:hypothetical protein|nr:hypothetical protein [Terracidiphilus sp.]